MWLRAITSIAVFLTILANTLPSSAVLPDVPEAAKTAPKRPPGKPKAEVASRANNGRDLYSQPLFDFILKQKVEKGESDTSDLRAKVRDELNGRELLVREAKKAGMEVQLPSQPASGDSNASMKAEVYYAAQTPIIRTYMADYLRAHAASDERLHATYDQIRSQIGDKEYKVRHILVETQEQARAIIASLQRGERFDRLAEQFSKDTGSRANGGDLDWNAPANFVKPFSDAMIALPKGAYISTPVQTQFGWHIIAVDDIRAAKIPTFDEVRPQLVQRLQGEVAEAYLKDLRAKNGL